MSRIGNQIMNHVANGPELPPEDRIEALAATLELVRRLGGARPVEDVLEATLRSELGEVDLDQYVDKLRATVGLKPRASTQG